MLLYNFFYMRNVDLAYSFSDKQKKNGKLFQNKTTTKRKFIFTSK